MASNAVALFAIGCVSLDWDGLTLTAARGYRTEPKAAEPYLPLAWQTEGGGDKRGLYWGSHSMTDTITFTTFGDHAGVSRVAFPDLGGKLRRALRTTDLPEPVVSRLGWVADDLIRKHLSFVRNGVPLEDGFYWVWHYLFGVANRELAAAGLLSDPYDPGSHFGGFLPVVWLDAVIKEQGVSKASAGAK